MTNNKKVICFPPERSISIDKMEEHIGEDLQNVRYEEHIDGTMINVFYNPMKDRWEKSTRSRIGANCTWLCKDGVGGDQTQAVILDLELNHGIAVSDMRVVEET